MQLIKQRWINRGRRRGSAARSETKPDVDLGLEIDEAASENEAARENEVVVVAGVGRGEVVEIKTDVDLAAETVMGEDVGADQGIGEVEVAEVAGMREIGDLALEIEGDLDHEIESDQDPENEGGHEIKMDLNEDDPATGTEALRRVLERVVEIE